MPFFGVPIRNGLPIGLGSVAGFGVQQFDPSQLFAGGTVAGAWYDPSDLSTLFTTSAGTAPATMPGLGSAVSVGLMLDKSGGGNHAIAFNNTTARPELRARVNLLTYSEEFNNGAWVATGVTVTQNSTVAPDGTTTADTITHAAATGELAQTNSTGAITVICSLYAKYSNVQWIRPVCGQDANLAAVWFDIQNGIVGGTLVTGTTTVVGTPTITSAGNGWYRCSMTIALGGTGNNFVQLNTADANNSSTRAIGSFFIWGADLRPANIGANVPAYQRIADANTYDTAGFPLYLRFDGVDDSMYTPANLNLSGTDKVAVFAGVRKLSDAAQGVVAELSATIASNNGTFLLAAPDGATQTYGWDSKGTTQVDAVASSLAAPRTNVLAGTADIASDSCIIRVNGAVADTETGDQGTGNFGTYLLYIGARNNASSRLNGHLYSLIIAGSAVSAGNITATEQWVAGKTGIVIS